MPRILVTTARGEPAASDAVLLDEAVIPEHLEDDHAAAQLVERMAWAVSDAADMEDRQPGRRYATHRRRIPAARGRGRA